MVGPWGDLSFAEVVQEWFGGRLGELSATGVVRRAGELEELPPFWEIGTSGVKVRVDPDTGQVFALRMATVADVGHAIHPEMLKGQDIGAATQGLGAALFEELVYDGPQLVNPNLVEYRVPRAADMPAEIVTIVAERGDGVGPYGAKGGGEGTLNPMGAAAAAAVGVGRWEALAGPAPAHSRAGVAADERRVAADGREQAGTVGGRGPAALPHRRGHGYRGPQGGHRHGSLQPRRALTPGPAGGVADGEPHADPGRPAPTRLGGPGGEHPPPGGQGAGTVSHPNCESCTNCGWWWSASPCAARSGPPRRPTCRNSPGWPRAAKPPRRGMSGSNRGAPSTGACTPSVTAPRVVDTIMALRAEVSRYLLRKRFCPGWHRELHGDHGEGGPECGRTVPGGSSHGGSRIDGGGDRGGQRLEQGRRRGRTER